MADNDEASASRKEAVYRFTVEYFCRHQSPPALRDYIESGVGEGTPGGAITTTSIVNRHLQELADEGRLDLLTTEGSRRPSRGIRIVGMRCVLLSAEQWRRLDEVLELQSLMWPEWREPLSEIREEIARAEIAGGR